MDDTTLTQGTPPDMPSVNPPSDGGTPPDMPSDGTQPSDGGGTPPDGGGNSSTSVTWSGATEITTGGTFDNLAFTSATADQNALLVNTSETVALNNPTVTKTGDSDGGDNTSFYGVNSGILVKSGSTTAITGGTVTTAANGANGIFSYGGNGGQNGAAGDGTTVYINGTTIVTTGDQSGGIMTTGGGVTAAANLNVTTSGRSSAAIRSDRGGGTVYVSGGNYTSNGVGSPAIYSTAAISVENAVLTSTQSEGVCIEGLNSVALTNCTLNINNIATNGNAQFLDGVMIYQSMSGDSAEGTSTFSMTGGTINNYSGHAFHVTNTNAVINLSGVTINNASGILLSVCDDGWSGASNVATINASNQALSGDILVGADSGLTLNLNNGSTFAGNIGGTIYNASGDLISSTVGAVNVVLDDSSILYLTGDTYLTGFTGNAANVITNGHNLYVNNTILGGTTDMATQITTGITLSDDGSNLIVDANYKGTAVNLSDVPSVITVDASSAGDFSTGFTIYGNSQNNYIQGSSNTNNTLWGGAGNNTLRGATALGNTFIYTGGGNDLAYFTPNSDRIYLLGTDIVSATRSGSNYALTTAQGKTLTLDTNGLGGDYSQIYFTTDGTNLKTAQIADVSATVLPYTGSDFTAFSQPGTLYVWGNADETYTLEDGTTTTFEGANHTIALNGASGKTYVNVYNVDASNSFGNDLIIGDAKSNIIIEGGGNNTLWGGAGNDTMVGGTGTDVFWFGKSDGNDVILNASSADGVNLYDVSLSDIVAANSDGAGTVSLSLNTGNTLTVQGNDSTSAKFTLADGSSWQYNRNTGSWQAA